MAVSTFNAEEVFEMAVAVERNGARFYRKACEALDEPALLELLQRLARMEDQHEAVFEKLKERVFGEKPAQSHAEYYDLAAAYLQALVENKIFILDKDPAEVLGKISGVDQLLEAAIDREKESIIYYVGLKELVPANLGREEVDSIIREEMSHVSLLTHELQRISGE